MCWHLTVMEQTLVKIRPQLIEYCKAVEEAACYGRSTPSPNYSQVVFRLHVEQQTNARSVSCGVVKGLNLPHKQSCQSLDSTLHLLPLYLHIYVSMYLHIPVDFLFYRRSATLRGSMCHRLSLFLKKVHQAYLFVEPRSSPTGCCDNTIQYKRRTDVCFRRQKQKITPHGLEPTVPSPRDDRCGCIYPVRTSYV